MKNYLLVFLLIILAFHTAKAQTDSAPIGAEWYYGSTGFINHIHYHRYWSEKDTVFEGQLCRKISGVYVPRDGDSSATEPIFLYSSGDTVLYYNSAFSKFTPIFIFNTKVGDTLSFYIPHYYFSHNDTNVIIQVIVEGVDTLTVDGVDLRRVRLIPYIHGGPGGGNLTMVSYYIERVGSWYQFLPFKAITDIPEATEKAFRCYKDHEISYQFTVPCDTLPPKYTSIEKHENLVDKISVYPNPSNGNFKINTGTIYPDHGKIIITDLSGRHIHQLLINTTGREIHEYSLPLSAGIYMITYRINNTAYTTKLLIQH